MSALARFTVAWIAITAAACPSGDGSSDDRPDGGFTDPDDDAAPSCDPDIIVAPTSAGCAAATKTCIAACDTDECWENCLAADPDPDACGTCLDDGYLACANAAGCQAQWDALMCCFDRCPDPESEACETSCSTEGAAYDTCIEPHDEACTQSTDAICYRAT